ncbi:MAG: homoserine kinase [Hyphomicrobiaceae bacterium]|nr:homoserine kinase [Hyphomicrobiaceae bacterium]
MAVYTDVPDDALAAFLAHFDLGELTAFKGIAEGVENSNFYLATTAGRFILTLYEKRVDVADLPFFMNLMEHVARNGVACPQPVARKDGAVLGTLCGRPAALITFLDGVSVRRPSASHCRSLGAALARFHQATERFEGTRRNALSVAGWRVLLDQSLPRADTVADGLAAEMSGDLDDIARLWPRDLPQGVIHADLFPDNVFFLAGEVSGFIDFYFACNDMLAYDLMICMNAWCFEPDHAFNVTKAKALLDAYQAVRPLSEAERMALPVLARGAAMRFLVTRLYDWLNVPEGALVTPKDPMEYVRKLRFHRSVTSARAYGVA